MNLSNQGICEPKRQGLIQVEVDMLGKAVDELHARIERLENRTTSIVINTPENTQKEPPMDKAAMPALAESIWQIRQRLEQATKAIAKLTDRIEL